MDDRDLVFQDFELVLGQRFGAGRSHAGAFFQDVRSDARRLSMTFVRTMSSFARTMSGLP